MWYGLKARVFEGIRYADQFSNFQNAINDLPSSGGWVEDLSGIQTALGSLTCNKNTRIILGNATYTTTGITINNACIIEGTGPFSFVQYTPNKGIAITVDLSAVGTPNGPGLGIRKLRLFGPGPNTSTTGIQIQGTALNLYAVIEDVEIDGFGTGRSVTTAAGSFSEWRRVGVFNNNINTSVSAETLENMLIIGGSDNNANAVTFKTCGINITAAGHVKYQNTSIDYIQLCNSGDSGNTVELENVYFECSTSFCGNNAQVKQTGANSSMLMHHVTQFWGGTPTTSWGSFTGGTVNLTGGWFNTNGSPGSLALLSSAANASIRIEPWPQLTGWTVPMSGFLSANGSFGFSGGRFVDLHQGRDADAAIGFYNSAAGANNWQIFNSATGSTCGAGRLNFFAGSCVGYINPAGSNAAFTQTIASGTATLNSGSLTTNTCQATVTVASPSVAATDTITWAFNTVPSAADALTTISAAVTSGNVNFVRCNPTSATQTTTAVVLNWKVLR